MASYITMIIIFINESNWSVSNRHCEQKSRNFGFFEWVPRKTKCLQLYLCLTRQNCKTDWWISLTVLKKAFNGLSMESRTVREWQKSFREGQEQTCDEARMGRPRHAKTEQNIEEVKDIRNIERRTTVNYIELELDFGQSARYIILTEDLNKHHV